MSTQLGSVRRVEDWREEVEKSNVHGGGEKINEVVNVDGNSEVHGNIHMSDGQQQFKFVGLEKVGNKKKKPFNLFKDKHTPRPKPVSPSSEDRPKKRPRSDFEKPGDGFCFGGQTQW
ncbi:hypothetical protein Hanom_Chr17g01586401 [Helianthus anomalus]